MAHFIELRDEPRLGESQWIDSEKVDAFAINSVVGVGEAWRDLYVVQFRSAGRWIGSAFIFGKERARAYALSVVCGEEDPLPAIRSRETG